MIGANPRIATFDGNDFAFNGLGDYWFVQVLNYGLQIRMAPCSNSDPSTGTCIRAVAFRGISNNLITFMVDPETGLLTIYSSISGIVKRNVYGIDHFPVIDNYALDVQAISTPFSESPAYRVSITDQTSESIRSFGFVLGDKMGANVFAVLNIFEMGETVGLCGTFDGCAENDFYSANQNYVSVGDSDANVYNGFADTCM